MTMNHALTMAASDIDCTRQIDDHGEFHGNVYILCARLRRNKTSVCILRCQRLHVMKRRRLEARPYKVKLKIVETISKANSTETNTHKQY